MRNFGPMLLLLFPAIAAVSSSVALAARPAREEAYQIRYYDDASRQTVVGVYTALCFSPPSMHGKQTPHYEVVVLHLCSAVDNEPPRFR